jgi:hypothetical protein
MVNEKCLWRLSVCEGIYCISILWLRASECGVGGGWETGIQSLDVLYSGNFQCCCDYIEEIALKESKNEVGGTPKLTGASKSERYIYIESKRGRQICVLSCLYPQLLLYLTHTKMWRYNPLLQQKETIYSSFLYRRVALGVWSSVALATCRLEHKSEGVCVLCGTGPSADALGLSSVLWRCWEVRNQR